MEKFTISASGALIKCQQREPTAEDLEWLEAATWDVFNPGDEVAFFEVDSVDSTAYVPSEEDGIPGENFAVELKLNFPDGLVVCKNRTGLTLVDSENPEAGGLTCDIDRDPEWHLVPE